MAVETTEATQEASMEKAKVAGPAGGRGERAAAKLVAGATLEVARKAGKEVKGVATAEAEKVEAELAAADTLEAAPRAATAAGVEAAREEDKGVAELDMEAAPEAVEKAGEGMEKREKAEADRVEAEVAKGDTPEAAPRAGRGAERKEAGEADKVVDLWAAAVRVVAELGETARVAVAPRVTAVVPSARAMVVETAMPTEEVRATPMVAAKEASKAADHLVAVQRMLDPSTDGSPGPPADGRQASMSAPQVTMPISLTSPRYCFHRSQPALLLSETRLSTTLHRATRCSNRQTKTPRDRRPAPRVGPPAERRSCRRLLLSPLYRVAV